jgi:hypothetical protein
MKTILAITCFALSSCAAIKFQPDSWEDKPNPLDSIEGEPTAAELHEQNMRAITSNPGYRLP